MNSELKEILCIIKSCAMDYDKQEEGMHTFEWGDLWILNEYIKELQQKVNQLEEQLNNPLRGIFAQVTDDELLRSNALNYAENKELEEKINRLETNWNELKEYIRKTKIKEFEKAFGKRYGKTFTQAEIIVCNMLIEKMQELEGGSNE